MSAIALYAALGLASGAAYGMLGLGLVLVYKGSGVVNMAQGAIAMVSAFVFVEISKAGISVYLAFVMVLLLDALFGVLIYVLVMRPLRTAPVLARVVASLGLLVGLQGAAVVIWGPLTVSVPSIFPHNAISFFGVRVGVDRLLLTATTVGMACCLWAIYRFTRFGLATRAAAESEKGATIIGLSADVIAGTNWALGSVFAGAAGMLIAPIMGLDTNGLTLLIVPALAAALLGGLSSFLWTAVVGLALGSMQSVVGDLWTQPGVTQAVPFVAIIVAMFVAGRAIPQRGALVQGRPPFSPPATIRIRPLMASAAVGLTLLLLLNLRYQSAFATAFIFGIIALSVVVVTGFVGQISLMQMTFAGVGAFATAKLAAIAGLGFPLPIILAALIAVPCGILLGLPAIRVRGVSLAVVTLGAATAVSGFVFQNSDWTGGVGGLSVPTPSLAGMSLDPNHHAVRFAIFTAAVLTLMSLTVRNLRRSATGRRMLAVRGNERAAIAAGINVASTKLQAFGLASFVAALGGALLAYQLGSVAFARFDPIASIGLVASVYIASVAAVSAGFVSGLLATGGPLFVLLNTQAQISQYWTLGSGALLIMTVIFNPDGIAVFWIALAGRWRQGVPASTREKNPADVPQAGGHAGLAVHEHR